VTTHSESIHDARDRRGSMSFLADEVIQHDEFKLARGSSHRFARDTRDPFLEYSEMPISTTAWMELHRDRPCVFRAASFLFTTTQLEQIGQLFVDGWKHDPGHILLSCVGKLSVTPAAAEELPRQMVSIDRAYACDRCGPRWLVTRRPHADGLSIWMYEPNCLH